MLKRVDGDFLQCVQRVTRQTEANQIDWTTILQITVYNIAEMSQLLQINTFSDIKQKKTVLVKLNFVHLSWANLKYDLIG